jgi:hypothetical protein
MNERIQQLSTQAVNYARENFGTDFVLFYKLWQEKFAELIVRECMDVAWRHTPDSEECEYSWLIHNKIKEHFGVEE